MKNNITPKAFIPDYMGYLGDLRLERRGQELWQNLSNFPCSSIRKDYILLWGTELLLKLNTYFINLKLLHSA